MDNDHDLTFFFYCTSKHCCFYDGLMPDFSVKPAKKGNKNDYQDLLGTNRRMLFLFVVTLQFVPNSTMYQLISCLHQAPITNACMSIHMQ